MLAIKYNSYNFPDSLNLNHPTRCAVMLSQKIWAEVKSGPSRSLALELTLNMDLGPIFVHQKWTPGSTFLRVHFLRYSATLRPC